MSLSPGARLGPYEIVALLGAGGMGEVYRARDAKLNRDVAIKVLPDLFAADPDRLARFTREAQTLAALNHPHIAQIYGAVENALVMELVEGKDLSDLLAQARGPLPLEDALAIARQIAEALEAAHEQGIIHRDLKPANIKVRADGTVKVLDFGLAKAIDQAPLSAPDAMNSPTLTTRGTQMGVIIGTAAYMAPEQARGKPVDRRADVWAFGVVLYEMLTGRRAFAGTETSDVLAAVLREDIDFALLPPGTPVSIRRLLGRCLRRERRDRLGDMTSARLDLLEAAGGAPQDAGAAPAAGQRTGRTAWAIGATALCTAAIVAAGAWTLRPASSGPGPVLRATIPLPGGLSLGSSGLEASVAISATHVAFVAGSNSQLYIRALDSGNTTPITGATDVGVPAFSPDGQWLAYFSQHRLRKVQVAGGPPSEVCESPAINSIAWGGPGILFSDRLNGISMIANDGGPPRRIARPDRGAVFLGPSWLPDGNGILYTIAGRIGSSDIDVARAKIVALSLAPGATPMPVIDGYDGRFVAPHSLVFMRDDAIVGVRFDPSARVVSGSVETLVASVAVAGYDVSANGTLLYEPSTFQGRITYAWVDRQNRIEPTGIPPQAFSYPRVSADGTRIVIASRSDGRDLWTWDIAQRALARLTFDPRADSYPVWMPDGHHILFGASVREGDENLALLAADGTGKAEILLQSDHHQNPYSVTADGEWVAFRDDAADGSTDIGLFRMSTREARPLIKSPYTERNAEISPDGRLLAYQSDETGAMEIYVRPFPNVDGGKKRVSNGGGIRPAWSRDGRRLFYVTGPQLPGTMNAVDRRAAGSLDFGPAEVVFDLAPFAASGVLGRTYDVAPDGRFLMPKATAEDTLVAIQGMPIVLNWAQHLPTNR